MWTRRAFINVLAAGAVAPATLAATPQPSLSGHHGGSRREELAAFQAFAEATHPRGAVAAADPQWRSRWQALALESGHLSDGQYFDRVRRALGWFHDGHTTVLPFEFVGGVPAPLATGPFQLALPLRLRVFDDGAWIVAAGGDGLPLLGGRLRRIGRQSVETLLQTLATEWPGNEAWAQRWSADTLVSPAFLHALGAIDDPRQPIAFEATAGDGKTVSVALAALDQPLPALDEVPRGQTPRAGWALAARGGNYVRDLGDGVIYTSIDDMDDVDGKTFEALTREVFAQLARLEARRLILDLRRNGGGNNFFGEPLRRGIGRSRCNRPGGLYVLAGPQTFSAAQNLANRLERETFALFVGGPTGGAPNHFGDARILAGPVTGITVMVSTLPWFDSYPQDQRPWILPDLPVPDRCDDWRAGRDRALETALDHRDDGAPDDLSRDRVFYFRRPSQQSAWKPFWRA